MHSTRNTKTERRCPDCQGHGGHDIDHPSRDPQLETYASCPACFGAGWIRWAPVDALEVVAIERRGVFLLKAADSFFQASARRYYHRAVATAAKRVTLPGIAA
jgi:hypothetical protein